MLCLTLRIGEWVEIGGAKVQFVHKLNAKGESMKGQIKVKIDAPREIFIKRLGKLGIETSKSYNSEHARKPDDVNRDE